MRTLCFIFAIFSAFWMLSCGTGNQLASYAPEDLLAQAELDMEAGPSDPTRYVTANEKLARYLAANPTNTNARSLYAASFAAQAGITLIGIVTKMMDGAMGGGGDGGGGGGSSGSDSMALLEGLVGEATAANVDLLKNASENMLVIDQSVQTASMKYQTGIFQSMYATLLVKKLKNDFTSGGTIDINNAQELLESLIASKDLLKDGATAPVSEAIGAVLTKIQTDNGGTLNSAAVDAWIRASQTP
jgi:hypothetical protein